MHEVFPSVCGNCVARLGGTVGGPEFGCHWLASALLRCSLAGCGDSKCRLLTNVTSQYFGVVLGATSKVFVSPKHWQASGTHTRLFGLGRSPMRPLSDDRSLTTSATSSSTSSETCISSNRPRFTPGGSVFQNRALSVTRRVTPDAYVLQE